MFSFYRGVRGVNIGCLVYASVSGSNTVGNAGLRLCGRLDGGFGVGVATSNKISSVSSIGGLHRVGLCNTVVNGTCCANTVSLDRTVGITR